MARAAGKKTAGQDEGFIGSISRFWNRSYAPDYVGFALLLVAYSLVRPSASIQSKDSDPCLDTSTRRAFPPHVLLGQYINTIPPRRC